MTPEAEIVLIAMQLWGQADSRVCKWKEAPIFSEELPANRRFWFDHARWLLEEVVAEALLVEAKAADGPS